MKRFSARSSFDILNTDGSPTLKNLLSDGQRWDLATSEPSHSQQVNIYRSDAFLINAEFRRRREQYLFSTYSSCSQSSFFFVFTPFFSHIPLASTAIFLPLPRLILLISISTFFPPSSLLLCFLSLQLLLVFVSPPSSSLSFPPVLFLIFHVFLLFLFFLHSLHLRISFTSRLKHILFYSSSLPLSLSSLFMFLFFWSTQLSVQGMRAPTYCF